jgi:hypothetical protein
MYTHYVEEKDREVEIDDDFEGYILTTYISDKLTKEVGADKIEKVIHELIDSEVIDTDTIKGEQGYTDYMEERYSDDIQDEIEEEEDNARAWEETLASLPR